MALEEQQLVIKWRSLSELREKLQAVLGELESETGQRASKNPQDHGEGIPEEVRKLGLNTFSAAMLAVLRDRHLGKSNAVEAGALAREMKQRYPLLFAKKEAGEVAHGTIFPGQKMAESGLVRMERVRDPVFPNQQHRRYWCE